MILSQQKQNFFFLSSQFVLRFLLFLVSCFLRFAFCIFYFYFLNFFEFWEFWILYLYFVLCTLTCTYVRNIVVAVLPYSSYTRTEVTVSLQYRYHFNTTLISTKATGHNLPEPRPCRHIDPVGTSIEKKQNCCHRWRPRKFRQSRRGRPFACRPIGRVVT